ncbi:MAG: response regulator transcription factor [Pyrinomonadaceae bacterium]
MKFSNRHRVLYAEDNADSREMVSMMCDFADMEVVTAETVAEAWQLAQLKHFDLYLLDIRFADGDGLELCRRLREYAPHTPILIYSGNAFEADKKNGLAAGASDYLTKPYIGDLAATIRHNIERTKKPARQTDSDKSANTSVRRKITNTSIRIGKDIEFYA